MENKGNCLQTLLSNIVGLGCAAIGLCVAGFAVLWALSYLDPRWSSDSRVYQASSGELPSGEQAGYLFMIVVLLIIGLIALYFGIVHYSRYG